MKRWALAIVCSALTLPATARDDAVSDAARAVIEATRTSRADYTVFSWNRITPADRAPIEEWAAEFNHGALHRVETPRDRLVANCDAMTGSHLNLVTGKIRSGREVAQAACGVDRTTAIVAASATVAFQTQWGPARKLVVRDARFKRTYLVADNGAIVAQEIAGETGATRLIMRATAMTRSSPGDIYSAQSLDRSAVPAHRRSAPRLPGHSG